MRHLSKEVFHEAADTATRRRERRIAGCQRAGALAHNASAYSGTGTGGAGGATVEEIAVRLRLTRNTKYLWLHCLETRGAE